MGEIRGEAAVVEVWRLWLQQCLPRAGAGSGAQCVKVWNVLCSLSEPPREAEVSQVRAQEVWAVNLKMMCSQGSRAILPVKHGPCLHIKVYWREPLMVFVIYFL